MLNGYRTLLFGIVVIFAGLLGKHFDPQVINNWLDVILGAVGVGIIAFRLFTKTPFGQRAIEAVATEAGLSKTDLAMLEQTVADAAGSANTDLKGAVTDLSTAVQKVTGHPLFEPATADVLAKLAENLPALISALPAQEAGAVSATSQAATPSNTPVPEPAAAPAAPAAAQPQK